MTLQTVHWPGAAQYISLFGQYARMMPGAGEGQVLLWMMAQVPDHTSKLVFTLSAIREGLKRSVHPDEVKRAINWLEICYVAITDHEHALQVFPELGTIELPDEPWVLFVGDRLQNLVDHYREMVEKGHIAPIDGSVQR